MTADRVPYESSLPRWFWIGYVILAVVWCAICIVLVGWNAAPCGLVGVVLGTTWGVILREHMLRTAQRGGYQAVDHD